MHGEQTGCLTGGSAREAVWLFYSSRGAGTASGGMGQVYPPAVRCRNSALAASSSAGCSSRSMAAAHSTLPAWTVALWAMGVLLQDTTCQLWQGTWLGHTATWICAVGH